MRYHALLLLIPIGCATAGRDAPGVGVDAHAGRDATADTATGCITTTADLLMNGSFDSTPTGIGWSSKPASPSYPIITSNGVSPQSAPEKAWMGSVVSATDDMHADVAVPPSTTSLVLAGYYQVRTAETGATVNDTAKVELVDTSDKLIESVLAQNNTNATTVWTPFSHTFSNSVAGKTVRLRFTTKNNSTKPTSFYFDTLSLQATSCQ